MEQLFSLDQTLKLIVTSQISLSQQTQTFEANSDHQSGSDTETYSDVSDTNLHKERCVDSVTVAATTLIKESLTVQKNMDLINLGYQKAMHKCILYFQ